jgi:uncharacterized protein (TIGR03083 family)
VLELFPIERSALLAVLESLSPDDWQRPTSAGAWTVKDVAAHLIADDLGRLSRQRDGYREAGVDESESLESYIDRRNEEWVIAMRRLSPRVIRSLLELSGEETQQLFQTIDPFALGSPVSWAGPEPAPGWLDLAREFTERWHHQQQIREAVGADVLDDPRYLRPVLTTFAFALVPPLRDVEAPPGTAVQLSVGGPSGGNWTVRREQSGWTLHTGSTDAPSATVEMDEDTAWRMYIRNIDRTEVQRRSTLTGDAGLATHILDAFALVS